MYVQYGKKAGGIYNLFNKMQYRQSSKEFLTAIKHFIIFLSKTFANLKESR